MKINLAYGQGHLTVDLPEERTTVIEPSHRPGLPNERAAVFAALDHPIAARPLREWIKPNERVCIAFTDLTRATPNERLIPWLLDYLAEHQCNEAQGYHIGMPMPANAFIEYVLRSRR